MKRRIRTSNGRTTTIDLTDPDALSKGLNRIVRRTHPGHYASFAYGRTKHEIEICREVGGLTEHTGEFLTFEAMP